MSPSKGCLLGSWPSQPAGWRRSLCILGVNLFRLCVFHMRTPSQLPSHIPLSCSPRSTLPPPSFQPLFLLLPCLALAHTLRITHSLYGHNSPPALAHEHTHSYCSGTRFPCILPVMHIQCPVTTLLCTPAHPHTQRATHPKPVPQLLAAKDGVMLEMSSLLLTLPRPNLPQLLPSIP